MSMIVQQSILDRWMESLEQIVEIDVIWLEGSLVEGIRVNPGSDIDIRVAIADEAYDRLWAEDKTQILAGLGETLCLLDWGWLRLLTKAEGTIIEIAAFKTSEALELDRHDWRFLLNRLPEGQPQFTQIPPKSAAENWPEREPLTEKAVWKLTEISMTLMANCPAPYFNHELHSAKFMLGDFRTNLIKLMYRRIGLAFAKRFKHFSEVLPADYLEDLAYTYEESGSDPLDPKMLAEAMLRTFEMYGKHLDALSQQAGGGFEPEWYWRLLEQTRERMKPFTQ